MLLDLPIVREVGADREKLYKVTHRERLYKITYVQRAMFRPHHRLLVLVNVDFEL